MPVRKQTALAAATAIALLCMPIQPAAAAGPLLFGPLALGWHVIGAVARLATLPLAVASAAVSGQQPPASYPPTPGYGGPAGYYAPPNYYPRPPGYYYPAPQVYYRPALSYARPMSRLYEPPRGYYASPTRYSGSYGSQVSYRSRGVTYRRR